ncbi:hypothetical protein AZE31_07715 [Paenibacillus polymyxa]|nr:hypothetical protein AZE31_07715 [Paenibacillus polymyxa]
MLHDNDHMPIEYQGKVAVIAAIRSKSCELVPWPEEALDKAKQENNLSFCRISTADVLMIQQIETLPNVRRPKSFCVFKIYDCSPDNLHFPLKSLSPSQRLKFYKKSSKPAKTFPGLE